MCSIMPESGFPGKRRKAGPAHTRTSSGKAHHNRARRFQTGRFRTFPERLRLSFPRKRKKRGG